MMLDDHETHEHFRAVVQEKTCLTGDEASKYALGLLDAANYLREAMRATSGRIGGGHSPIPAFTAHTARLFAGHVIDHAQAQEQRSSK